MLLEFKTKNFKTFRQEAVFSMIPAPKQKGLEYSVLKETAGGKEYSGLSSAVIYGPNASGKTNIIGAIDTLKNIVLRGNIRNSAAQAAGNFIEMIPCSRSSALEPVHFAVSFINGGLKFDYFLSVDIGGFLAKDYARKVLEERLSVNEEMVFERTDIPRFGDLKRIEPYWARSLEKNLQAVISVAESNTEPEDLFLTNGFKHMFSSKLAGIIVDWFEKKLMIQYKDDKGQPIKKFADMQQQSEYIGKTLNEAAKAFGIRSNALGYLVPEGETEPKLYSLLEQDGSKTAVSAEQYESYGTMKFIHDFPLIIGALTGGSTLFIDEFDTSIHPMALMNIIGMFHNDDINKNNAQLIFNTHNPIFLDSDLYRRDEIKFVERDDETHESVHYSLSDFGGTGTRRSEDYMKKYFISQYGAIRDIDFSPIFAEEAEGKEAEEAEGI